MNKNVIVRVPFRVSFFGGGTDFPEYFNKDQGVVIGTTINKYSYVSVNLLEKILDNNIKLSYSKLEIVRNIDDLIHPLAKQVLLENEEIIKDHFVDMHSYADLPSGTGIASSSAFTVGIIIAFNCLMGKYNTPKEISLNAIEIERLKAKLIGGWQDQIHCAFGGLNKIVFQNNDFQIYPISIKNKLINHLEDSLFLVHLDSQRSSNKIQENMINNNTFDSKDKLDYLNELKKIAQEAYELCISNIAEDDFLSEFGRLLNHNWLMKKKLNSSSSTSEIDQLYDNLMDAGIYGGKLIGAGGGGFLLILMNKSKKQEILNEIGNRKIINIKFENNGPRILWVN